MHIMRNERWDASEHFKLNLYDCCNVRCKENEVISFNIDPFDLYYPVHRIKHVTHTFLWLLFSVNELISRISFVFIQRRRQKKSSQMHLLIGSINAIAIVDWISTTFIVWRKPSCPWFQTVRHFTISVQMTESISATEHCYWTFNWNDFCDQLNDWMWTTEFCIFFSLKKKVGMANEQTIEKR